MDETTGPEVPDRIRPGGPPRPTIQEARWYPDPTGRFQFRYWDGTAWTAHVATQGANSVDTESLPLTLAGPPAPGPDAGSPRRRGRRRLLLMLAVVGGVAIVLAVGAIANRTVFNDHLWIDVETK